MQKTQDQTVRDYARRMVKDHEAAAAQLEKIAGQGKLEGEAQQDALERPTYKSLLMPVLGDQVAAPLGAGARRVVLDGGLRVRAAAFVLPAHDQIAAGAQLPDVTAQVHVAVFQSDRIADAQSAVVLFVHYALLDLLSARACA